MEMRIKDEGDESDEEEGEKGKQHQDYDEKEEEIIDSGDENYETHIHDMDQEPEENNVAEGETVTTQEEGGFEANIVDGNFIIRIPNQHHQERSLAALHQLSEQSANIVDINSEIVEEIEIGHQEVLLIF